MIKNSDGIYQFESLLAFPELIHGYSTRAFGDMGSEDIKESFPQFASALHISIDSVILMEQVHGSFVRVVLEKSVGNRSEQTDGMISDQKNVFLCVRSADCVPLLAYDPEKKMCGIAHAGWKGAISDIAAQLISKMKKLGSNVPDIRVGIGPSIRVCCYAIENDRRALFAETFPEYAATILQARNGVVFCSLQALVKLQLESVGIIKDHIEDSGMCTKDMKETFYSFRRNNRSEGVFAGIIGMI